MLNDKSNTTHVTIKPSDFKTVLTINHNHFGIINIKNSFMKKISNFQLQSVFEIHDKITQKNIYGNFKLTDYKHDYLSDNDNTTGIIDNDFIKIFKPKLIKQKPLKFDNLFHKKLIKQSGINLSKSHAIKTQPILANFVSDHSINGQYQITGTDNNIYGDLFHASGNLKMDNINLPFEKGYGNFKIDKNKIIFNGHVGIFDKKYQISYESQKGGKAYYHLKTDSPYDLLQKLNILFFKKNVNMDFELIKNDNGLYFIAYNSQIDFINNITGKESPLFINGYLEKNNIEDFAITGKNIMIKGSYDIKKQKFNIYNGKIGENIFKGSIKKDALNKPNINIFAQKMKISNFDYHKMQTIGLYGKIFGNDITFKDKLFIDEFKAEFYDMNKKGNTIFAKTKDGKLFFNHNNNDIIFKSKNAGDFLSALAISRFFQNGDLKIEAKEKNKTKTGTVKFYNFSSTHPILLTLMFKTSIDNFANSIPINKLTGDFIKTENGIQFNNVKLFNNKIAIKMDGEINQDKIKSTGKLVLFDFSKYLHPNQNSSPAQCINFKITGSIMDPKITTMPFDLISTQEIEHEFADIMKISTKNIDFTHDKHR